MEYFIRSVNIYKLCILCIFKLEKKDFNSWIVDGGYLECKV